MTIGQVGLESDSGRIDLIKKNYRNTTGLGHFDFKKKIKSDQIEWGIRQVRWIGIGFLCFVTSIGDNQTGQVWFGSPPL